MRIIAKTGRFSEVVEAVREVLPPVAQENALGIAEGNIPVDALLAERILSKMADPDELCELV